MAFSPGMAKLATLTDDELAHEVDPSRDHVMAEFTKRLVGTNRDLIQAIGSFKSASDRASKRLERATVALVALTVVIAVLTGVLVVQG